jgi:quercetin dioxygenase-like cupin family protein
MTAPDDFPLVGVDLAALRWFDPRGRAVQRLYASAQCDVLLVGWEPGQQSSYHEHGGSESVVYVLEGRITAENEGVKRVYGPFSVVITPRAAYHRMSNDGPEPAMTLHIYAPPMPGGVSQPYRDHTAS